MTDLTILICCLISYFKNLSNFSFTAYFPIVVLPKGARHIRVHEKSISSNYLAIRNIYGQYYLNGDRRVAWPGIYTLGGASFQYRRPYNEPETLDSVGPLEEDIILEVSFNDHTTVFFWLTKQKFSYKIVNAVYLNMRYAFKLTTISLPWQKIITSLLVHDGSDVS